ncbi:transporter substrate-binding domain-containing protein [Epibacterium sp. SM1979]|uniref:Transporter substrate-binding domain-containing protein n=1 Tax=Tritonibacter litoralis TaxID=2662264 RepID=A0A843Y9L0_9RHOB|nr:transporter substrate-binding domain-containing protein [Tritonibacter litoralis]MQQ07606.1 transporter substrate-binding domain-containing protein [Tritonibacter litoralis]
MKTKLLQIMAAAAITLSGAVAQAETYIAYTASLPPYTIAADADMPGISHELLTEMANRAGVEIDIQYLPWKRAQATVQKTPNSLLFTASRSAAREDIYGWVVEMVSPREAFVTTSAPVNSLEEGAALSRIAILAGTPRERRLNEAGFTNLQASKDTQTAARLLEGGRVEAWYTLDQRAAFVFKSEGFDPSQLTFGEPTRVNSNWLASNKEFPADVSAALAAALDEMRADGTYDAILAKYLN